MESFLNLQRKGGRHREGIRTSRKWVETILAPWIERMIFGVKELSWKKGENVRSDEQRSDLF